MPSALLGIPSEWLISTHIRTFLAQRGMIGYRVNPGDAGGKELGNKDAPQSGGSEGGQPPTEGVAHEGGRLMDVELTHEAVPMRLDRFDTQAQGRRNLLRRLPLRDALDYLTLPRGEGIWGVSRPGQIRLHDGMGDPGTQIHGLL
jgi:hypothetical protein